MKNLPTTTWPNFHQKMFVFTYFYDLRLWFMETTEHLLPDAKSSTYVSLTRNINKTILRRISQGIIPLKPFYVLHTKKLHKIMFHKRHICHNFSTEAFSVVKSMGIWVGLKLCLDMWCRLQAAHAVNLAPCTLLKIYDSERTTHLRGTSNLNSFLRGLLSLIYKHK